MTYRPIFTLGILSALLVGGSRHEGYAQSRSNPQFLPYSKVGFGLGTSTYFGDLAGYSRPLKSLFTLPRWNVGVMYGRQFTPRIGVRASFTWARITGDDYTYSKSDPLTYSPQFVRNLHFRNDLKEFALIGTYDFIPGGRTPRDRPKLTPYALLGVALVAHNPKALTGRAAEGQPDSTQRWVALQPLGTEGQGQPGYAKPYSLVTISVPIGIGVRYKLSEYLDLAAEIRMTPTFSDYLDDVGGNYPNPADLATPLARAFSNRGFTIDANGNATIKELYAARTGESRQAGLNQLTAAGINPDEFLQRGGGSRIPLKDSYLLTSFQIHYIIPAKIKCPPIR
ncbi:DUF6089 family protein [Fibrella forsythiae]|uniref:DUF6089 domain-containing protein n=1 Tax=Fibrella forsythiae TaxID=2817061 RepID=A0ABS3JAU1_9BACT|nr:DUF6089 family protein [Fibrella forsythiae]MBO0947105.1 hypothetical protein [Fibrella forsythiae]